MSSRCYDQISRHGLTEVYSPAKGGDRPIVHIIFVHGLFGHPEKTWTGTKKSTKTAQQGPSGLPSRREHSPAGMEKEDGKIVNDANSGLPDVFWPAEILPKAVPNTKIWTWGYDADIDGFRSPASQNTVAQHATNLVSDVADLLETKECNLPIIFVVHSLGGLIVKAAVNTSSGARGNRFKVVVPAVYGILFLGTPHRGSKSASIGKMAFQITKAAARRPNEKLLQALEKNSDTLDQINDHFLQTLEEHNHIAISSFREEKETRKFLFFSTIVVESDSARIGLAREELNSIPTNHRDMAKLSSLEDIGFKRVSAQIRRWIQSLPATVNNKDSQEYIDCVRSLDSSATKARLKAVAISHSETLQWLFDSNVVDFPSWLQDSDNSSSSIYWIQGKPGSGKSTLMKFAMMDPRLLNLLQTSERLPYVISGFFFHDRGTLEQKSVSGMLQELLHSIILQSSALRQFVQPIYTVLVEAQRSSLPIWNVESLQRGLEAIIKQRQVKTRLCLFLDALDEHHGDNEYLASLMKKLVALADGDVVKIKLCLASRPWDTFVTSFSTCPGFKIHDHTYNDIRAYTLSEFRQSTPVGIEKSSAGDTRSAKLEALAIQVTEKAHGVFIWVRIVVEEITRGLRARTPLFVLEEMLAKMPEELKDLYEHTLERIEPDHAEEAYVMLQIALCALSPLLLETFVNTTSHAVWLKVPDVGEETVADMTQRVISRSGGLLEVIEPTVMDISTALASGYRDEVLLVKQVAVEADVLSEGTSKEDLRPGRLVTGHRVQFIHQTVKEYVQNREDNFGLKRSLTGGTGFHYILAAAVEFGAQWTNEIGFDLFEYARLANLDKNFESQRNLRHYLDRLWDPDNNRVDLWMMRNRIQFYKHLIRYGTSPDLKVICLALAAGLFEYVDRWLNTKLISPLTALCYVATIGPPVTSVQMPRRNMLNILVQHGLSVEEEMLPPFGSRVIPSSISPLALIIETKGRFDQDEKERVSAMACLLDHGANPNVEIRDQRYKTAFLRCIQREDVEVVRLFGQYGATLPGEMILPLCTLWQMVSVPSPVLMEVIQIMKRGYPDVDFDEKLSARAIGQFFSEKDSLAAAPILAAVAAIGVGIGGVFSGKVFAIRHHPNFGNEPVIYGT